MTKKIYGIIAVIIFAAILVVPTLIWGGMIISGGDEFIQNEIIAPIESENRRAKSFADVLKGKTNENGEEEPFSLNDLTANLESLYNDYAPFRGDLVYIKGKMMTAIERPYKNTIGPALVELFYGNKNNGEQQIQQDTTGSVNMDDIFGASTDDDTTTEDEEPYVPLPDSEVIGGDPDCNHSFGEAVEETPVSCDTHGSTLAECSKCDAKQRVFIAATGHDYEDKRSIPSTCLIKGMIYQKCSKCKKTKSIYLPLEEHKFEQIKTVEANYDDCGYDLYQCSECALLRRENIVPKLIDTSVLPVSYNGDGRVIYGRSDWLFYTGNNMEKYYTGANVFPPETMDLMVNALDQLNIECQKRGIKLVVAFWPNKCDVYSEYMPTYEIVNSVGKTETMSNYVNANTKTGVVSIYPKAELLAAKSYFQTYYRLDTHWNNAGAFMGAQALLKVLGMETTDIRNVLATPVMVNLNSMDLVGMLSPAERAEFAPTADEIYNFDYHPEVDILKEETLSNKGTLQRIEQCETTNKNGKTITFLGDSFRTALYPILRKDFTYSTFAHSDSLSSGSAFDKETILNAVLESDVLVIARGSRVDNTVYTAAQKLTEALRNAE